jgi:hypothetical protein
MRTGVVGLLQCSRRKIKLHVVGLFARLRLVLVAVRTHAAIAREHINALGVDGRHQVVQFVGRGDVTGQQVVNLTKREVALLFPGVDEFCQLILKFVDLFDLVDFFSHGGARSCGVMFIGPSVLQADYSLGCFVVSGELLRYEPRWQARSPQRLIRAF